MKNTRIELLPHVYLTHVKTSKFKTGAISVNLLTQLDHETAAQNAILPRVLLRGTANHPDMAALAVRKEELYGAQIVPIIRKKGEVHCVGLFASFVDDDYLPKDEGILAQTANLLGEILLTPTMQDGHFRSKYVEGEKENLIDEIRAVINNKRSYAVTRLVECMCEGEAFATFKLGSEAKARGITAEPLTRHYANLLATAPIELFYCGSAPLETVQEILTSALDKLPQRNFEAKLGTDVRQNAKAEHPRYFEEELDVGQGKLSLGFRLGACMASPNGGAIALFNSVYGGSVNSKLFLNVRERLSLCYYASSVLEEHKGLLIVASGIEIDKYQEAKDEILAQLDAMRKGEISDEELDFAKRELDTDLQIITDEIHSLENFYLKQTILGRSGDLNALRDQVKQAQKADIIDIAKGIQLDAVYFLRNKTKDEGEGA